jgi:hypothetical protein
MLQAGEYFIENVLRGKGNEKILGKVMASSDAAKGTFIAS